MTSDILKQKCLKNLWLQNQKLSKKERKCVCVSVIFIIFICLYFLFGTQICIIYDGTH